MLPVAPARFSITTGWPQDLANSFATRRAMMSVVPPAEKPTKMCTSRFGQSCAWAACTASANTSAAKIRMSVDGDVVGADEKRPFVALGTHVLGKYLGRAADGLGALLGEHA